MTLTSTTLEPTRLPLFLWDSLLQSLFAVFALLKQTNKNQQLPLKLCVSTEFFLSRKEEPSDKEIHHHLTQILALVKGLCAKQFIGTSSGPAVSL